MAWSEAQISALAPDASSLKAGRGLALPGKWPTLGASETALWGECQGSGSKPYRTQIDLREPAFKCSCPSRKFPCKHGLGLFFLFALQPDRLTGGEPPEWVQEWLTSREARGEAKEKKQQEKVQKAADPTTQAKTQARRESRAEAGLAELEQWLQDLMRRGLASIRNEPYHFYDQVAARMVDAQLPGLARRLRSLAEISAAHSNWAERLLAELGLLYLLVSGYRQRATLAPELAAEIETQMGWNASQEGLVQQSGQAEVWYVSGISHAQENALRLQRIWLWGETSGDSAMVLDFAFGNTAFKYPLAVGQRLQGEVVWFPGTGQRRALLKPGYAQLATASALNTWDDFTTLITAQQAHLAVNPWSSTGGAWFQALRPRHHEQHLYLEDPQGHYLPVGAAFQAQWELLALSGGHYLPTFVEWEGQRVYPLTLLTPDGPRGLPLLRDTFTGGDPMTASVFWTPWIKPAMLGTAQAQNIPTPEGDLAPVLQGVAGTPEQCLLAAAGATALATAVCRDLPQGLPPLTGAEADTRPMCPEQANACLPRLLEDSWLRPLLPEWLAYTAERGWQVPPELLPLLLETARYQPNWQPPLLAVLGPRGRWLAAQNPAWRYVYNAQQPLAELWPEATGSLRTRILQQHFATQSEALRSLLAETWPLEKAEHRAEQLTALQAGLTLADEPLLEQALDDRSKEVRAQAQQLLATLSGSASAQRMQGRGEAHLSLRAGKVETELPVPETVDAAWLRDGLSLPAQVTPTARVALLTQILAAIPPGHWVQHWSADITEIESALGQSRWKEPLLRGWYQALARYGTEAEVMPLVFPVRSCGPKYKPDVLAALLLRLSWPARERWLTEALKAWGQDGVNPPLAALFAQVWQQPWSEALTVTVCLWLAALPNWVMAAERHQATLLAAVVPTLLLHGEPAILRDFLPDWLKIQGVLYDAPVSEVVRRFPELIAFRIDMLEAFV